MMMMRRGSLYIVSVLSFCGSVSVRLLAIVAISIYRYLHSRSKPCNSSVDGRVMRMNSGGIDRDGPFSAID